MSFAHVNTIRHTHSHTHSSTSALGKIKGDFYTCRTASITCLATHAHTHLQSIDTNGLERRRKCKKEKKTKQWAKKNKHEEKRREREGKRTNEKSLRSLSIFNHSSTYIVWIWATTTTNECITRQKKQNTKKSNYIGGLFCCCCCCCGGSWSWGWGCCCWEGSLIGLCNGGVDIGDANWCRK